MTNRKNQKIQLNLPFINQQTNYTCAVACLRMCLAYFNKHENEKELEQQMNTKSKTGTSNKEFSKMIQKLSKSIIICPGKLKDIEKALIQKFPVIINFIIPNKTPLSKNGKYLPLKRSEEMAGHFAVICGMESKNFLIHDPYDIPYLKMPKTELARRWESFYDTDKNWMAVIEGKR